MSKLEPLSRKVNHLWSLVTYTLGYSLIDWQVEPLETSLWDSLGLSLKYELENYAEA